MIKINQTPISFEERAGVYKKRLKDFEKPTSIMSTIKQMKKFQLKSS